MNVIHRLYEIGIHTFSTVHTNIHRKEPELCTENDAKDKKAEYRPE